jgi:hypothetical protein
MFNLGNPTGYFRDFPWFEEVRRDKGEDCHECGRRLKTYHRRLSRSMARGLLRLHRLELTYPERKYFHVKLFDKEGARGEFGVLSSWGFTHEQPNETFGKKSSGHWCLTDFGRRFILLQEKVPQYVILKWGSELLGFSGSMVDVRQCLQHGNKFNYEELMTWTPDELAF